MRNIDITTKMLFGILRHQLVSSSIGIVDVSLSLEVSIS